MLNNDELKATYDKSLKQKLDRKYIVIDRNTTKFITLIEQNVKNAVGRAQKEVHFYFNDLNYKEYNEEGANIDIDRVVRELTQCSGLNIVLQYDSENGRYMRDVYDFSDKDTWRNITQFRNPIGRQGLPVIMNVQLFVNKLYKSDPEESDI